MFSPKPEKVQGEPKGDTNIVKLLRSFYHGREQANEEGFSLALYSHPVMKPARKIPKKSIITGSETQKDASRRSNFKGKSLIKFKAEYHVMLDWLEFEIQAEFKCEIAYVDSKSNANFLRQCLLYNSNILRQS